MPEKNVLSAEDMRRALTRMAHEVLERNRGATSLAFVGMYTRGVPLARRLAMLVKEFEGVDVPVGTLDISLYRDDLDQRPLRPLLQSTQLPFDLAGRSLIVVDDVLFTGRSARAALDALLDIGRPATIQLAVLVDRGHRELPIRADYVGKNLPTALDEEVVVHVQETDGEDNVGLISTLPAEKRS